MQRFLLDLAISNLEERLSKLKTQMDAESAILYAKNQEFTENSLRCDKLMAREQQLEQELADVCEFPLESLRLF